MKRRAFLRTAAGVIVPAATGLAQIPLSTGDAAYLGKSHLRGCGASVATAWAAQVVTNGGAAPSALTTSALANFWCAVIAAGIDSKMLAVNCFAPDNLTAAITPLYHAKGSTPWTNHNFVSGDLTVNGLAGDGSTRYLDTGITPSTDFASVNSGGGSVYGTTSNDGTYAELGSYNSDTQCFFVDIENTNKSYLACWGNGTSLGLIDITNDGFTGFVSGSRRAANDSELYKANSGTAFTSIGTNSSVSGPGTRPSLTITAFALNFSGAPIGFSPRRLSFAAIHDGLTSAQTEALYNAVQTMRTALGGGYV